MATKLKTIGILPALLLLACVLAPARQGLAATPAAAPVPAEDAEYQAITRNFLRKKFWLILTTANPAFKGDYDALIKQHLRRQVALEKSGILFAAGPVTDRDGKMLYGMFILRAGSEAEAKAVADADPMHQAGARTYVLQQWMMNEGRIGLSVDFSDGSYKIN